MSASLIFGVGKKIKAAEANISSVPLLLDGPGRAVGVDGKRKRHVEAPRGPALDCIFHSLPRKRVFQVQEQTSIEVCKPQSKRSCARCVEKGLVRTQSADSCALGFAAQPWQLAALGGCEQARAGAQDFAIGPAGGLWLLEENFAAAGTGVEPTCEERQVIFEHCVAAVLAAVALQAGVSRRGFRGLAGIARICRGGFARRERGRLASSANSTRKGSAMRPARRRKKAMVFWFARRAGGLRR